LTQLAKNNLALLLTFFLLSCVGPIKEIKYQIEDSWDDSSYDISNPLPLKDISNSFSPNVIFSGSFDYDTDKNLNLLHLNNQIYYASKNGWIISLNHENNSINWKYSHDQLITGGITGYKDNLFFVDYDGYLVCLSSLGAINWKSFVGEIFAPPLAIENIVIVRTTNNKFIALNNIDGSITWDYKVPSSPLPLRSWGELVESDGIIYSGISSGKVVAVNAKSGLLVWESTFSAPRGISELERSNDTTSKVIVDDYVIYAISSKGNVSAISREDGNILWSRSLSSFYGMEEFGDSLIITHNSGSIYQLSKDTNKVLWRNADLQGRDVSRPFLLNEYIMVSDFEGYLHFLNATNGKIESRLKVDDSPLLYPVKISDDVFLVTSIKGNFIKIRLADAEYKKNDLNNNKQNNLNKSEIDSTENNNESFIDTLIFWE
jgi:outer membrane protein assembly factor BamB